MAICPCAAILAELERLEIDTLPASIFNPQGHR